MLIVILVFAGLCFGSFVNALVWRVHEQSLVASRKSKSRNKKTSDKKLATSNLQNLSILKGRSMCTHCHHILAAKDLIPVLSWVELAGKCRYCGKKIEDTPVAEVLTALLFVISYLWWPMNFNMMGKVNFIAWLVVLVGFVALLIYDLRWMLLPNRIVYPLIVFAAIIALLNITVYGGGLALARDLSISILVAGGIFYGLFQISKGKWIGGGDVKLGFLIGILVAKPLHAFLVLFLASLIGTLVIVPGILTKKLNAKSHIPFGPFLIIATVIVMLFGASIVTWYRKKFLLY